MVETVERTILKKGKLVIHSGRSQGKSIVCKYQIHAHTWNIEEKKLLQFDMRNFEFVVGLSKLSPMKTQENMTMQKRQEEVRIQDHVPPRTIVLTKIREVDFTQVQGGFFNTDSKHHRVVLIEDDTNNSRGANSDKNLHWKI